MDEASLAEVDALIGEGERKRDLLIEYLHLIQDKYSCLEARHMRALAETMKISMAEVYEVASFYDHFDIVKEGEAKPAPVTRDLCTKSSFYRFIDFGSWLCVPHFLADGLFSFVLFMRLPGLGCLV